MYLLNALMMEYFNILLYKYLYRGRNRKKEKSYFTRFGHDLGT